MDFLTLAKTRYSTRGYTQQRVEQEKLDYILEAARVAPTGCNKQAFKLIVIQSEEGLAKLKDAANYYDAPLAILICQNIEDTWHRSYDGKIISDIDASIISDHMILAGTAQGLSSLWLCKFKPDVLRENFHIPDGYEPVNLTVFGYPSGDGKSSDRHATDRKPLSELVIAESF